MNKLITKLHSISLYTLVLIFSYTLKGKKTNYKNYFCEDTKDFEKLCLLKVKCENYSFFEKIRLFFDKKSELYDKTLVSFDLDISTKPEENKYFLFDFFKILNIFHSLSMLSSRIPNENIYVSLDFEKQRVDDLKINHLLRYSLLTFASRKVDKLILDKSLLKDEKSLLAYETMISYLDNTTIENFTHSGNLYVITCKKDKKKFDIVWSSKEDIELTDFNKVYDKFGNQLTKNIKITTSPIYAYH